MLLEVAGDAREIEDLYGRASILTSCADALWEADQQSARTLFRRAWETATESDDAELKEEQTNGRYGDLPERFTRARDNALTLAGSRDPRMAETFLRALTLWLESHESSARDLPEDMRDSASHRLGPLNESTPNGQRLSLAFSLLTEDSYKSAVALAEPALADGVSGFFVEFLLHLRELNADEADRLYLRLLKRTRGDARSDANDILLLSTYVLTPRLLAVVDRQGSVRFRTLGAPGETADALAPQPRTRAAFFDTAASILLRPAQPAEANAGGDSVATYFTAGRLLPFFEREAPQHAAALHARLNSLAVEIEVARRNALDSQMKAQSLSPENPDDPLRPWLEKIGRSDPSVRDEARISAVRDASKRKLWDRARRLADEIEDEGKRREARFVIAARQVASLHEAFAEGDADDFEKAALFVRNAELTTPLRAYGFAQAAEIAARRGKRARAAALLDEAFGQTLQTENGTSLRDAAAMMAATVAARIDSPRAPEMLSAAVVALNEDAEFSGETIWFNLETRVKFSPGEPEALNDALQSFTVEEMFDAAALRDFDRAVAEARHLKNGSARALALVASARAALEKGSGA